MKKVFQIDGITFTYRLVHDASGMRIVATDDQGNEQSLLIKKYHFDPVAGTVCITTDGGVFVVHVTQTTAPDGSIAWAVASEPGVHTHHIHEVMHESFFQSTSMAPSRRGIEQYLTSPLAGRVSKVLVKPGQRVIRGAVLLLIESMKMENELCAQGDAVVKTVFIQEADVVQLNQLLVEFEKEGDSHATPQNSDGS